MSTEKKKGKPLIPDLIMNDILQMIQNVCYGEIILIIQDDRLIQIERNEKLRLEQCGICRRPRRLSTGEIRHIRSQIASALLGLSYGKIEIVIKGNQVVRIDKTEKKRFADLLCEADIIQEKFG